MAPQGLGVENQVLKLSSLHGHEQQPSRRVDGCDHSFGTACQGHRIRVAVAYADAASQARVCVDKRLLLCALARVCSRNKGHCADGTDADAPAAPRAIPLVDGGQITGRVDGVQVWNLRAAIMASQQQPQQLQIKLTCLCTFSANWTRLFS